ncbi:hypothetical protein C4D60_Mb02t15120 [Musa balbisiana]|uniref:Uncharacterized protein n=1 Tax=Musa balbisiana TaxID=52838 RepID=A0A4S8IAT9_MUSBA|nr:hypothetical protein C4D60_Mb02t15120 [Musa balbisiana]
MPPRGYALIFFFWALLAIITPTLVVWSASAKQSYDPTEKLISPPFHLISEATYDVKVSRRMMGITETGQSKNTTARTTVRAPRLAPAPAPAPAPLTGNNTSS